MRTLNLVKSFHFITILPHKEGREREREREERERERVGRRGEERERERVRRRRSFSHGGTGNRWAGCLLISNPFTGKVITPRDRVVLCWLLGEGEEEVSSSWLGPGGVKTLTRVKGKWSLVSPGGIRCYTLWLPHSASLQRD